MAVKLNQRPSANQQFEGYSPQPWQADVHRYLMNARGTGKMAVVKSKRQCGKTYMCENQLLYFAINYNNTTSAMISPTLNQSRKVYKELVKAIQYSNIIRRKNETLLEIELWNGSIIFFKSSEQRDSLRGYTISGILIIDEAAFISDDILQMVSPWCNVHRAPMLIVSTPMFRNGFFHQYYEIGMSGDKKIKSFDWNDYDTSIFLSSEQLEYFSKIMPKSQFKTEYLGLFADDNAGVFSGFRDCVLGGPVSFKRLYVGIDFSNQTGNDYTVISALNERGEQVFLYYFNDKTSMQQVDFIVDFLNKHKNQVMMVIPELNSLGTPLTDMIKDRVPWCNIQGHITSNKSKNDIVNSLQVAFERREIRIMNDEKQLQHLSTYAVQFNPKTRTITYNAPQGLNDDCCIALALSWKALSSTNNTGNYIISFSK